VRAKRGNNTRPDGPIRYWSANSSVSPTGPARSGYWRVMMQKGLGSMSLQRFCLLLL
jgi:hypothetical protein